MLWKLTYIIAPLWVILCAPAQLWSLTTTSTYNPDNSLATLTTPAVATLTYGYDANGNRTGETYSNVPATVLNKASRSLDYDAQDRLTKQELADGNKQTWTLSAVGNWTQTQLNQNPAQTRTHTATHQIASMDTTALSYDAKGNMTTDQRGYVYRWDHENRLIEVLGPPVVESATTQPDANPTPGSTTQPEDPYADPNAVSTPTSQPTTQPTIAWRQTYTYDAMGRRVSRTTYQNEVASTTVYVSAGMQEVAEYTDTTDAAAPSRTYVYGSYVDEPVQVRVYASATTQPASTQNATTQPSYTDYYYHSNALYSVIAVTDTAGAVVERYTYDAYGQRTITDADGTPRAESILGNEIGFSGRRLDPLTNQYYFRARYYDATQGRFISRDPLEYVDGMSLYGGYYVPNGLDPEGTYSLRIEGPFGPVYNRMSKNCEYYYIKYYDPSILDLYIHQISGIFGAKLREPERVSINLNETGFVPLESMCNSKKLQCIFEQNPGFADTIKSQVKILMTLDMAKKATADSASVTMDAMLLTAAMEVASAGKTLVNVSKSTTNQGAPASTPVGRSGDPMNVPRGTNPDTTISGRNFNGHAIDQMQGRGVPPSVVENTIQTGTQSPDPIVGRIRHYDQVNNITVITESSGTVVTVITGKR